VLAPATTYVRMRSCRFRTSGQLLVPDHYVDSLNELRKSASRTTRWSSRSLSSWQPRQPDRDAAPTATATATPSGEQQATATATPTERLTATATSTTHLSRRRRRETRRSDRHAPRRRTPDRYSGPHGNVYGHAGSDRHCTPTSTSTRRQLTPRRAPRPRRRSQRTRHQHGQRRHIRRRTPRRDADATDTPVPTDMPVPTSTPH